MNDRVSRKIVILVSFLSSQSLEEVLIGNKNYLLSYNLHTQLIYLCKLCEQSLTNN